MSLWHHKIKPLVKKTGIQKPIRSAKSYLQAFALRRKTHESLFNGIYKNNTWNGVESVSGQGSDLSETQVLLDILPALLEKYKIQTIIDLPCGDYNWMQHLNYDFKSYIGIDIVEDIINKNNVRFGNDKKLFLKKDCLRDDLGDADLLLCRDLLIHFSQKDVYQFFENLKQSNIRYLLTTHFIGEKNKNIVTGQWHPINLTEKPYCFPEPKELLFEKTKMFNGKYAQTKTMALWELSEILSA
ncbi:MAG: class I SAM-dependent methyltransferase [Alphaproteobacteria bacterium]|nr:class I SAM-dependent methyltransferase [Alphaproteobacteria bacterium]NCQ88440.1 class I SAM-dependent methyltransferase [Alphaproteobacteria bacterium]NCT05983.1 class I SAM-dependent methyltransferase [Alphaproteobacteria bacterium]